MYEITAKKFANKKQFAAIRRRLPDTQCGRSSGGLVESSHSRSLNASDHQNIPFWWWGFFIFGSSKKANSLFFFLSRFLHILMMQAYQITCRTNKKMKPSCNQTFEKDFFRCAANTAGIRVNLGDRRAKFLEPRRWFHFHCFAFEPFANISRSLKQKHQRSMTLNWLFLFFPHFSLFFTFCL